MPRPSDPLDPDLERDEVYPRRGEYELGQPQPDPRILDLELSGLPKRVEYLEKQLNEVHENLMFQSLLPAFDNVPLRREFPFCIFVPSQGKRKRATASTLRDLFGEMIAMRDTPWMGSGPPEATDVLERVDKFLSPLGYLEVRTYPLLKGSVLYRSALRTYERQTRKEFEDSQLQLVTELAKSLRTLKVDSAPITVNVYLNDPKTKEKPESMSWAGNLKDLSEALKNILLIGVGCVVLFGGTLIKSEGTEPNKPLVVKIVQMGRDTQIKVLPKILDAAKPEDFQEVIEAVPTPSSSAKLPEAKPTKGGRESKGQTK